MAAARETGIAVESQASARKVRSEGIDNHVAGAGVESKNVAGHCAGGNYREIRDSAEIQGNAGDVRVSVKEIINERHERSALAPCCDVRRAKIGDCGDASPLGDKCGLADLECGGDTRAEEWGCDTLMINGLAMRADEGNALRRNAKAFAGAQRGIGKSFANARIELADFARGCGCAIGEPQNGVAHGMRVGKIRKGDETCTRRSRLA